MVDPVNQDLNRHLAEEERREIEAEAIDAIVQEWMSDDKAIAEAWSDILCEENAIHPRDVVIAVTGSESREQRALALLEIVEAKLKAAFEEGAPLELEKRRKKAASDYAEMRYMDREDGEC